MGDTNEALGRLVAQVEAGADVLVGGAPARARQLMREAAGRLAGAANVVSVASPIGELGLSALIAQLSGRPDLDEQDDAVLELGFKRLGGEGQTVLMLLAPEGVSRSALRYLQHVARALPRLTLVLHDTPALATTLEQAGLTALRDRLHAALRVEAPSPPEQAPVAAVAIARPPDIQAADSSVALTPVSARPLVGSAQPGLRPAVRMTPAGRPALWLGAALGAAAIAGVAFVGQHRPGALGSAAIGNPAVVGKVARADLPVEAAVVPEPRLASVPNLDPDVVPRLAPSVAERAAGLATASPVLPPLAVQPPFAPTMPQIALASPPTLPTLPQPALPHPDPVAPAPAQRVAKSLRVPQFHRAEPSRHEAARLVQAPPYWSPPPFPPPGYEASSPYEDMPPRWMRRERPGREGPYLGTFAMDPYGVRTFRYDP